MLCALKNQIIVVVDRFLYMMSALFIPKLYLIRSVVVSRIVVVIVKVVRGVVDVAVHQRVVVLALQSRRR